MLLGVISDERGRRAIITNPDTGMTRQVPMGEELATGIQLLEVGKDYIIALENNDKRRTVRLYE